MAFTDLFLVVFKRPFNVGDLVGNVLNVCVSLPSAFFQLTELLYMMI